MVDNIKRTMTWNYNSENNKEYTNIEYNINNLIYRGSHEFIIPEYKDLENVVNSLNVKYELLENYTNKAACNKSKNIEIVIYK